MIGNKLHGMLGARDRCNHNLRFRVQGKSNICLICQCNQIDDLLNVECGGNRKLSSDGISEIIHQFRVINSLLDAPIEESYVEFLLSPVLRTLVALLKIHNDEVGAVVAQALDKLSLKVPLKMLDDFLEKLSAQILEKISYGNLDCLTVLIRNKECRNSFLRNHGSLVLPEIFQKLEHHVLNTTKCASAPTISSATQLTEGYNKENLKWPGVLPTSATIAGRESLKMIEKLFEVMDANCPSDICVVVTATTTVTKSEDSERPRSPFQQKPFLPSQQAFQIYNQYLKEIILLCVNLLSSSQVLQMTLFSTKILNFLEKLHHYPESLRCLFSDKSGIKFCTLIKKLLYTHSTDIKTAALCLVNRMVVTYKSVMEESNADKTFIEDLPNAITEVDLIHFITEAMNTSCEILFRAAIQVLDQINSVPQFRLGIMIPVLESTLRISTMHIPDNITAPDTYISLNNLILNILTSLDGDPPPGNQHQLIYLFERLPTNWSAMQYLSWIKLLLFCSEGELQGNLWSLFLAFVQRSKHFGSSNYVVQLKCVLLIAYALMKCKCPQAEHTFPGCTQQLSFQMGEMTKQLMHFLMDASFVPTITALVRYGTADDSMYITTLLKLLECYPEERLSMRYHQTSFGHQATELAKVTFGSGTENEDHLNEETQDAVYEIAVDQSSAIKINDVWCWSAKFYMQILTAIRLNPEFITSLQLFHLWNENVANIISICYPLYLPQLRDVCGNICSSGGESGCDKKDSYFEQREVKQILEKLDIDALTWTKTIGHYDFLANGSKCLEKRMHDMILAFYFFVALFAGKDVMRFLDEGFVERYATFLGECNGQYDLTQEGDMENELDWTQMSFQYRVALMIASAIPYDAVAPIAEKVEVFLLEDEEAKARFRDEILISHCEVFIFILKWKIFPEYVSLVERWLREDRNGCISFYANGNFDDSLNEEINNSLLTIAAEGDKETSLLAVELGCKRLKKFSFSFEYNCVIGSIHSLYRQIMFNEDIDEGNVEIACQNSLTLLRLSNVMQLAIDDEFLFCSNKRFPSDFLHQVIRIMLNFHGEAMVGRRCLEFLSKILRDNVTFQNVNQYLISHRDFILFLGRRLQIPDKNNVEESIFAYKLLALLVRHNLVKFSTKNASVQGPPWIQWELTSVFMYLHSVPKTEILEFLVAISKVNFKCPLIQVQEMNAGPTEFGNVLMNLVFHLQALSQKIKFREPTEAVWEILCEILRLASEKNEIVNHAKFYPDLLFQQWMKISVIHLLAGCNHVPSKAPLMALEFLEKWTKMLLVNFIANETNRTPLQQTFVFQSYVLLFKTIMNDMKTDPSQTTAEEETKKTQDKQAQKLFSSPDDQNLFDIERKSVLIAKIVKTCGIFLANFSK